MNGMHKLKQLYLEQEEIELETELKKFEKQNAQWLRYYVEMLGGDPARLLEMALNHPLDKKHENKLKQLRKKNNLESIKDPEITVPGSLQGLEGIELLENRCETEKAESPDIRKNEQKLQEFDLLEV